MRKFIIKLLIFIVIIFLFISGILFVILNVIPSQFDDLFQSEIVSKYNLLKNENKRKIIYVGGSGGAFCVNANKISEELGVPFINMALHAGFGYEFETEITKANINEGDLILLGIEEGNYFDNNFYDTDLLVTAMNDNFELYNYLNEEQKSDFWRYLPQYMLKKLDRFVFGYEPTSGAYSKSAFNDYGTMTYKREAYSKKKYIDSVVDIMYAYNSPVYNNVINYFNSYKDYVYSKKADIRIVYPVMSKEKTVNSVEELKIMSNTIEKTLEIPSIYSIDEALYEQKYMYDTYFHCNSVGQDKFSDLLIKNLKGYIKENWR